LLTLGPYAANCKTGPAIWLRCMIAQGGAIVPVAGKPEACATFAQVLQQTVYFNPYEPIEVSERNLPHWRQPSVTYFVAFRLADALPAEKLTALKAEREAWLKAHPKPHSAADQEDYHRLFSEPVAFAQELLTEAGFADPEEARA